MTWPIVVLGAALAAQAPASDEVRIVSPREDTVVLGDSRVEVTVTSPAPPERVSIFVDGRLECEPVKAPYRCRWDAGGVARSHHIRVVAYFADGHRLVANTRSRDLGYAERINVDAVQVPVVVTSNGQFVRNLQASDFELTEDGVSQPIASLAAEGVPLDLVLAIDISDSMTGTMDRVKAAVKQLLARLRPGDAATLLGFNDTTFIVAERETDQRVRESAVDLLAPWGGTALYDATIRALDLVRPEGGRKGVVIFSDGDDHDSVARRATALARAQSTQAMIFTVAFGYGSRLPALRRGLEGYARATGGRAFFAEDAATLDRVFGAIVDELANQYMLSYTPTHAMDDGSWHTIKVRVRGGKYQVRARDGYRARSGPRNGG
jgi:Ca-activated chloride channel family protein